MVDRLDRATLIRALAERGIDGARDLLRRTAETDRALQERLAHLRERLRRQAARRVVRTLDAYDRRAEEIERTERQRAASVDERLRELEARRAAARALRGGVLPSIDLGESVRAALLAPDASWNRPPPRPSWLARIAAAFRSLWEWLRGLFGRRRRRAEPAPPPRTVVLARLATGGRVLAPSDWGELWERFSPEERGELSERVDAALKEERRALRDDAEDKRRRADEQRRALAEERKLAEERARRAAEEAARDAEARTLERELTERRLVEPTDHGLAVTYGLVERFAELLLDETERSLPGHPLLSRTGSASTGLYEKARLRQAAEVAHLDVPSSLVAARLAGLRHIDESTSYVYREVTAERVHVVVAMDRSGSMAEDGKLDAAKRAFLALYVAVRRRYPDATIDVVAFDNHVHLLDLVELWETAPGSFTNTAEVLRTMRELLAASRATRKEAFLLTDGLPESYTDPTGAVRSGDLTTALARALEEARRLGTVRPLRFAMILLKSEHPEYEAAARSIAAAVGGDLLLTDPSSLGVDLLVRWASGVETTRVFAAGARARPPTPARVADRRGRRRRPDRRMGG